MSSGQMQTKRLRKKTVSVDGMDISELKPRMIDHLRVSKPSFFHGPSIQRESKEETEFVKDGSVVMRSGTVQHSRMHPTYGSGFGHEETCYPVDMKMSETYILPQRPSKDTNKFHKKAKQKSSELVEPRRLPTACFGLNQEQETKSYATQVVDSQPEVGESEAHATQETKYIQVEPIC